MDTKEAKKIIEAGFAWAGWTVKQRKAFKIAYDSIDKSKNQEKIINKTYAVLGNSELDEKDKLDNLYEIYYD
jgi:hypothetical protein